MLNKEGLTARLPQVLADRRPRVVVIGDVMMDGWTTGQCERLCREAPAPVVDVTADSYAPGGAGNTAANLAALGAETVLVTALGDDHGGDMARSALRSLGVSVDHLVTVPGRRSTVKRRILAGDQLLVRLDEGDRDPLPPEAARRLGHAVRAAVPDCDAVVVCDYSTGVLDECVAEALSEVRDRIPVLVVDSHAAQRWRDLRPDVVTPNAAEAAGLLGRRPETERLAFFDEHGAELRAITGAGNVVVTLDRDGALLLADDIPPLRTWARPAPDNHTAGAGDTFVAALTLAAAAELPLSTCIELAQAAADVVVHRPGTAVCSTRELVSRLGEQHGLSGHDDLARLVAEHRAAGRRIVFTNGCFDVLHRGHVAYLNQAKRLGDVLVVALNDDESVRRLKGRARPVNTVADRAAVLAGLSCVDHVTSFGEDTPAGLIRLLRPEIYAKGGDYTPDMLTETPIVRQYGGQVRILDYVSDQSTSAVIDRIRATAEA